MSVLSVSTLACARYAPNTCADSRLSIPHTELKLVLALALELRLCSVPLVLGAVVEPCSVAHPRAQTTTPFFHFQREKEQIHGEWWVSHDTTHHGGAGRAPANTRRLLSTTIQTTTMDSSDTTHHDISMLETLPEHSSPSPTASVPISTLTVTGEPPEKKRKKGPRGRIREMMLDSKEQQDDTIEQGGGEIEEQSESKDDDGRVGDLTQGTVMGRTEKLLSRPRRTTKRSADGKLLLGRNLKKTNPRYSNGNRITTKPSREASSAQTESGAPQRSHYKSPIGKEALAFVRFRRWTVPQTNMTQPTEAGVEVSKPTPPASTPTNPTGVESPLENDSTPLNMNIMVAQTNNVHLCVGDKLVLSDKTTLGTSGNGNKTGGTVILQDFSRDTIHTDGVGCLTSKDLQGAKKIVLDDANNGAPAKESTFPDAPIRVWVKRNLSKTQRLIEQDQQRTEEVGLQRVVANNDIASGGSHNDDNEDPVYRLLADLPPNTDTHMLDPSLSDTAITLAAAEDCLVPAVCPLCGERLGKPFKACLNQSYDRTARAIKHCNDSGHEYLWMLATSLPDDCKGESITLRGYIQRLLNEGAKSCDPVPSVGPDQLLFRIGIARIMAHATALNGTNRFLDLYGTKAERKSFKEKASRILRTIDYAVTYHNYKVWIEGAPMLPSMPASKFYNAINLFFRQGLFWENPHPALINLTFPELYIKKRGGNTISAGEKK